MSDPIPLHIRRFGERIRAMNAGNSKELRMPASDARGLHSDIFEMLEELARLREAETEPEVLEIKLDAGDNSL